ncbi:MAG: MarR family winged helix-turn-helix transcriptional regulator [Aquabacterium sp.]
MKSQPEAEAATSALVLRQFRIVFNAVKSHFQQMEKQAGIGGAQVWALGVVKQTPGIGVGALAQAMDIHQSTASNLVKALVQRALLRIEKDDRDRRAVRLFITPQGDQVLALAPAPWSGLLPEALAHMDETRLRRMHDDLQTLITLLGDKGSAQNAAHTPLADL